LPISSIIRYFNREEASGQPMQAQIILIKTLVLRALMNNAVIVLRQNNAIIHLQTKIRIPSIVVLVDLQKMLLVRFSKLRKQPKTKRKIRTKIKRKDLPLLQRSQKINLLNRRRRNLLKHKFKIHMDLLIQKII